MPIALTAIDTILLTLRHPVIDRASGLMTKVWSRQFEQLHVAVQELQSEGGVLYGLHAGRVLQPSTDLPAGELWYESDRTVFYVASTTAWMFAGGMMTGTRTQAPTDLGVNDAGFLFFCTDFGHLLAWSGTQWGFAAGDSGNGYFGDFAITPSASLWAPCDGTATTYLTPGATLTATALTTPNLQSGDGGAGVYRKGSAAYGATILTGGGSLQGGGANDPAHINILPFFRR